MRRKFRDLTGRREEGIWVAPGRVNLIGEHVDYNDGCVLPLAIDRVVAALVARRDDGVVRCWSSQLAGGIETSLGDLAGAGGWAAYPLGVLWAMREAGAAVPGVDVLIDGRVPLGAGMSSSAAVECTVALAVDDLTGAGFDRRRLAEVCRRAENEIAGVPVGIMDQTASLLGRAGQVLHLDCRSLEVEFLPLAVGGGAADSTDSPSRAGAPDPAPAAELLHLLVVDTGVRHELSDGSYKDRRDACAAAARALGVRALRDASLELLAAEHLDEVLERRARHVLTEMARVESAARLLRAHDLAAVGPLLTASHVSLRDDFEVSTRELDGVVQASLAAGALGARMMGGGFGGSVIALVPASRLGDVTAAATAALATVGREPAFVETVRPAGGATRVG